MFNKNNRYRVVTMCNSCKQIYPKGHGRVCSQCGAILVNSKGAFTINRIRVSARFNNGRWEVAGRYE